MSTEQVIDFLDLGRDDNIRALASVVQNSVDNHCPLCFALSIRRKSPLTRRGLCAFERLAR